MILSDKKARKIEELISKQESILSELKSEIDEIDSNRLISENEKLRESLSRAEQENEQLKTDTADLKKQLETAKASLFAKMANEKIAVFSKTQRHIENMYYIESTDLENRLLQYKQNSLKSIELMKKRIEEFSDPVYKDLSYKIQELENEINQQHYELSQKLNNEQRALLKEYESASESLRNEGLTETEKRIAVKQKSLESFIGLNVMSKAGILLFLIGIIALGRFAYVHLTDVFKSLMIFALGAVLIAGGELFHKKEKSIFSTALISGGVAVLYAAVATSYFALDLFSVKVAFVLCIVVTVIANLLSIQIKNQVVCAFGAVGGYLPLIATYMIGFGSAVADKTFLPVSAVYFCMLAATIFLMTYNKHWYAAQYIGYGFQLLSIIGIARCAWVLKDADGFAYAPALAAGFAIASFIIYLLMPAAKIIKGKAVSVSDIVLMGLNTVSGSISVGITVNNCFAVKTNGNRIVGIVFLVFAVIYALLSAAAVRNARVIEKTKKRSVMNGILFGGLIVFSLLVVPFSFGWTFVGIAWAAEGTLIAVVAKSKGNKLFESIGFACMMLSVAGFIIVGYEEFQSVFVPVVIVSLTVMILCFWAYTVYALKSTLQESILYIILESVVAAATAGYLIYIYNYVIALPIVKYYSTYSDLAAYALCFALVAVLLRLKLLDNRGSSFVSFLFRIVTFGLVFGADIGDSYHYITLYYGDAIDVKWIAVINLILLVLTNVLAVILLSGGVSRLINKFELPAWIYTAVISIPSLLLITTVLTQQFDVRFSNVLISALYIAVACVLLFIGFKKRYTVVRAGGLVLILAALAKLCFVDTHALTSAWKIGAYFAFGAVLIAISFIYQQFSKKLEKEANALVEESVTTDNE